MANPASTEFRRKVRLFSWFLLWVAARIKPKRKSDPQAKPSSVLQVLLAIRRIHKLKGLLQCLPPTAAVTPIVKGMVSRFRDVHGPEALLPHRKEPIPYVVVDYILEKTPDGPLTPKDTKARCLAKDAWNFCNDYYGFFLSPMHDTIMNHAEPHWRQGRNST